MLSDALIGLVLISAGLILYTQVQFVMADQLEQRQERVLQLRHQLETQFRASKRVAK